MDRHGALICSNPERFTFVPIPDFLNKWVSVKGTWLLKGESVIFHFGKDDEYLGTVISEEPCYPATVLNGKKVNKVYKQTRFPSDDVRISFPIIEDKGYFEHRMLENAVKDALSDDGDNCAIRALNPTKEQLSELISNVIRSVSPIIDNMKYAINEKDKYGKYWHDLAQERVVTINKLERASNVLHRIIKEINRYNKS